MKKRVNKNKTEIWYQRAKNHGGVITGQRYRLLYQDNKGNWFSTFNFFSWDGETSYSESKGCFSEEAKFKTKEELIKAMRAYDRRAKFPKAIKLGDFL